MKERKIGVCHICGKADYLTFEHVPPKGAFNNHKYFICLMNHNDPFAEPIKKWYREGGVKVKTLCAKCNNDTGGWYGNAYIDWCYFGMEILRKSQGKPSLFYFNKIFPLRIIKQIIVMMFSVNGKEFRELNPYLERFVLNKNVKNLPPEYKVYAYYNYEGNPRYQGYAALGKFYENKVSILSEITFPPYGFVLTLQNSQPPDPRLTNVTYFADFSYDTEWEVDLCLNPLATWLSFPGDYRKKEEIEQNIANNTNRR